MEDIVMLLNAFSARYGFVIPPPPPPKANNPAGGAGAGDDADEAPEGDVDATGAGLAAAGGPATAVDSEIDERCL
jgi:hypothetical protein